MKVVILSFFLIFFASANTTIYYGALTDDLFQNKKLHNLLFNIFNRQLQKEEKFNIKFIIDKNENEALNKYVNGQYKVLSISPMRFYKNQKILKKHTKEYIIPRINGKAFFQYYLIANKESKNIFKNLEDYTIYLPDGLFSARIWLKNILHREEKINLEKNISNIVFNMKSISSISDVYLKNNKLSVIEKDTYELLLDLNPQLKKRLKIIKKSKQIYINTILLVNKNITNNEYKRLEEIEKKTQVILEKSRMSFGSKIKGIYKLNTNELEPINKELEYYYSIN